MNGKPLVAGVKHCLNCEKVFEAKTKTKMAKFCSPRCGTAYRNSRKYENGVEGFDYIRCPECHQKVAEVTLLHARMHGFGSPSKMASHFGLRTLKSERIIGRMQGSNNPGYQHGGTRSPWSNKNVRMTVEDIASNRLKAKINAKGTRPNELASWLAKGYSKEDAIKAVHTRQETFNLKICIDKLGEEEGTKRWKARQDKWQATLDSKSDEEKQRINKAKMSNGYSISKHEIALLSELRIEFPDIEDQKYIKVDNIGRSYDIALGTKLIEFFGDFWHHHPDLYGSDWINPYTKKTSTQRWDLDRQRIQAAESLGYSVLVVWECDWISNKNKVIEQCKSFLTK